MALWLCGAVALCLHGSVAPWLMLMALWFYGFVAPWL